MTVIAIFSVSPAFVQANTHTGQPEPQLLELKNPIAADNLAQLLKLIVKAVNYIMIPIIVLAIIYVGFKFVMARGEPGEITKAKEMFRWVIVGAAIILAAELLIEIVTNTITSLKP